MWIQRGIGRPGAFGYGVCIFGDYVAVVGAFEYANFLVLLESDSGKIVRVWAREVVDRFYNCISIDEGLYVGSEWGVYLFDKNLRIKNRFTTYPARAVPFIASDGSYIYIVSEDERGKRVEKRSLDLAQGEAKAFSDLRLSRSNLAVMEINPVSGDVWVMGYAWHLWESSLFAIFDEELNLVKVIRYGPGDSGYVGIPRGGCFDKAGSGFIAGSSGVAKLYMDGSAALNEAVGGVKIACIHGKVFLFDYSNYESTIKVFDNNLNMLDVIQLKRWGLNVALWIGRPAFDGRRLYVAGYDQRGIVVFAIDVGDISVTRVWK